MRKFFLLIVILALVAVFIWPTRYKEYPAGKGPYAQQAGPLKTRMDRTTGAVYVFSASGEWKALKGARPELLRPDITGPVIKTRVDTAPAQQQGRLIERMQKQTAAMEKEARAKAGQ